MISRATAAQCEAATWHGENPCGELPRSIEEDLRTKRIAKATTLNRNTHSFMQNVTASRLTHLTFALGCLIGYRLPGYGVDVPCACVLLCIEGAMGSFEWIEAEEQRALR